MPGELAGIKVCLFFYHVPLLNSVNSPHNYRDLALVVSISRADHKCAIKRCGYIFYYLLNSLFEDDSKTFDPILNTCYSRGLLSKLMANMRLDTPNPKLEFID